MNVLKRFDIMSDIKIYGNENIIQTLTSMIDSGRLSQGILLFGDAGLGKKTIAEYIAAKLLCNGGANSPCGQCKSCRMIMQNTHPDVQWVVNAPKSKAFGVDNIRSIISDSYIYPNEGDRKIYIFADCDTMLPAAQNTLLKIIEEPPAHVFFIFTATSKAVFLSTILSRVVSIGVSEVSLDLCKAVLQEKGVSDNDKIEDAVSCFGGNIGKCISFINDEGIQKSVMLAKKITDAINARSEYDILAAFNSIDNDKVLFKNVTNLLSAIVRDCCAKRTGSLNLIGCYKQGSEMMVRSITLNQADELYRILTTAQARCDSNVSMSLLMGYLCASIKSII